MVSIQKINCATRQNLGNLERQSWLRDKVARLCCVSDIGLKAVRLPRAKRQLMWGARGQQLLLQPPPVRQLCISSFTALIHYTVYKPTACFACVWRRRNCAHSCVVPGIPGNSETLWGSALIPRLNMTLWRPACIKYNYHYAHDFSNCLRIAQKHVKGFWTTEATVPNESTVYSINVDFSTVVKGWTLTMLIVLTSVNQF